MTPTILMEFYLFYAKPTCQASGWCAIFLSASYARETGRGLLMTDEDWTEIERFIKLLAPFKYTTKRLEGNASRHGHEGSHGAVWEVIPTFQHLYNGLLKAQADAKDEDSQYKIGLNLGVEKMNTY